MLRERVGSPVSIASMVLTTNCLVTEIPENKPKAASAPMY